MPYEDREIAKAISDIREWLVKIDTNQTHQTELLKTINQQATNAFNKADIAEDTAEEALSLAKQTKKELDSFKEDEKVKKRWLIGVLISIVGILTPILLRFYL